MSSSRFLYPRCCYPPVGAFYLVADLRMAPSNVSLPCELIHEPCMFLCEQRTELRLGYVLLCHTANRQTLRMWDRLAAFALTLDVRYLQSRPTRMMVTHVEVYRNSEWYSFHDFPVPCAQILSIRAVAFFWHHESTSVRRSASS